ncbi:type II secretion system F family protein [Vibrio stylophorae]|uniref:type II secretion system F family protein n=1 Tax=Vibrio stylophorae TaxID=659351 RepID=UPI003F4A334C
MDQLTAHLSLAAQQREWIILGMILLATTLVILTIGLLLFSLQSPLKRRLKDLQQRSGNQPEQRKIEDTLESLEPYISPTSNKERETVRHQLMHAGFHQQSALTLFYAIKFGLTMLGLIIGIGIAILNPHLNGGQQLSIVIIATAVGLFLPNFALYRMKKHHQFRMRQALPDALDLLVVCTESGLGLNAALMRVSQELVISHPAFADELDTVCVKIKAGMPIADAFHEMIVRTGLTEMRGLVNTLAHASRIGASIGQTLRDYTEDYRDKRNQAAEEMAAKIPTKMIFPLVLFIWPCFFIVAIGPAILHIITNLFAE